MSFVETPKSAPSSNTTVDSPSLKGEYEGRLVYVADCGVHEKSYKGEVSGWFHQVSLGLEIIGQEIKITDEDGTETTKPMLLWTKPFWVASDKMGEKSTHFKLHSQFDPSTEDGDTPDWGAQLGKPVSVIIEQTKPNADGNSYNNIKSISSIPTKYQKDVGEMTLKPNMGTVPDIGDDAYGLVVWLWDNQSSNSVGYAEKVSATKPKPNPNPDPAPQADDFDDDIPF